MINFEIFATNLNTYNMGSLEGQWIKLPCELSEIVEVLGTDKYFITDYVAPKGITISEFDKIDTLNDMINNLSEFEEELLIAYAETVQDITTSNYEEVIESLENASYFTEVYDNEDLGIAFINEIYGDIDQLDEETVNRHLDLDMIRRDLEVDGLDEDEIESFMYELEGFPAILNNPAAYFDFESFGHDLSFDYPIASNGIALRVD